MPSMPRQSSCLTLRCAANPSPSVAGLCWPLLTKPRHLGSAADQEAWNQATRARYDEFDTLENALLQAAAAGQAIDKIGPVVAFPNSPRGWPPILSPLTAN